MKTKFFVVLAIIALLFGCASMGDNNQPIVNEEDLGMAAYIFVYAKPETASPLSAFCSEVAVVNSTEALQALIDQYLTEYQTGILGQPYVQMWLLKKAERIGITLNLENATALLDGNENLEQMKSKLLLVCDGVNAAVVQLQQEGRL